MRVFIAENIVQAEELLNMDGCHIVVMELTDDESLMDDEEELYIRSHVVFNNPVLAKIAERRFNWQAVRPLEKFIRLLAPEMPAGEVMKKLSELISLTIWEALSLLFYEIRIILVPIF